MVGKVRETIYGVSSSTNDITINYSINGVKPDVADGGSNIGYGNPDSTNYQIIAVRSITKPSWIIEH